MSREEPVEYPIDGTLDLHTFHPREVKDLVVEYIRVCRERGIYQIRIIHGKGTGTLRRIVHGELDKIQAVEGYWQEGGSGGSWGATIVRLKHKSESVI
jgi:DNA-nicking Smr family endonuclease